MAEKTERESMMTPECMLAFHDLFHAKAIEAGKTPTFNATLVFSPAVQQTPEFAAMKAAINRLAGARWPTELQTIPNFAQQIRVPLRPCEEKPKYYADLGAGWLFMNVSTQQRPGVVKVQGNGTVPILDENEIYSGCFVRVTVSPYVYPKVGETGPKAANKGVSFGLGNVLKIKDGPRRGGRPTADADFGAFVQANPAAAAAPAEALFGGSATGGLV